MLKSLVDRFTASPLIGIDIGSAMLKVVELASSRVHKQVGSMRVGPIGSDSVQTLAPDKRGLYLFG